MMKKNLINKIFFILLLFSNLIFQIKFAQAQFNSKYNSLNQSITSIEIDKTRELIELRRYQEAEIKINNHLKEKPRDAQWRYLKALLLAEEGTKDNEQKKIEKSIEIFERITEEFPELAEPYNNLAVLYIWIGESIKARESLETAIANRPDYILAYENLADLHIFLAKNIYKSGLIRKKESERLRVKSEYLDKMPYISKPKLNLDLKNKKKE